MGGPPTPAVGFAFGVERAVMVLQQMSDIIKQKETLVFVAPIGFEQQTKCFYLVDELRRVGIKCEMDYSKSDLKSQLKQANKIQAGYTLIFGEAEAEKNTILIKSMQSGQQVEVAWESVISYLKQSHG